MSKGIDVNDKIARAYSRLVALRKNTPDRYYVDEEHVRQYHEALQHLADLEFDIAEFRVPDQWLERRVAFTNPLGTHYRKERDAETSKFLSKLDAVLQYFFFHQCCSLGHQIAEGNRLHRAKGIGRS